MSDYIFDLDGTVYSGNHTFPSIVQLVKNLPAERVWFLSNSDRFWGEQIYQRLVQIGINVRHPSHVLTAQDIARYWIANQDVNCGIWAPGVDHLTLKDGKKVVSEVGEIRQDCDRILLCLSGVRALVAKHGERVVSDLLRERNDEIVSMNLDDWVSRNGAKQIGLGGWMKRWKIDTLLIKNLGKPSTTGVTMLSRRGLKAESSIVVGDNICTDGALAQKIGADFLHFHSKTRSD